MVVAIVILLLAVLAWAVFIYNRLVRLRNQVRTAWADIDVQLTRRHDLVPQLVAAVRAYAGHEAAVLEAATALRAQALAQPGPQKLEFRVCSRSSSAMRFWMRNTGSE